MIKQRETNSWKSVSYAKSITGTQTYTKFPIVLRTTDQSIPTWSVKGNTTTSGTPSPSNPVEVNGVGVRTENLFDFLSWANSITSISGSGSFTTTDDSISITSGTSTDAYTSPYGASTGFRISVKPSTTYTCKIGGSGSYQLIIFENGNTSSGYSHYYNVGLKIASFTTKSDTTFVTFRAANTGSLGSTATLSQVMFAEGEYTAQTMPPYEPCGYKIPITSEGKNLFDKNNYTFSHLYVAGDNKIYSSDTVCAFILNCEPNTTYTVAKMITSRFILWSMANYPEVGGTFTVREADNTAANLTITTGNNDHYILFMFEYTNSSQEAVTEQVANTVMYNTHTTTSIYLGEVQSNRKICKLVLDGTETLSYQVQPPLFLINIPTNYFIPQVTALCTEYNYNPVQSSILANSQHGDFGLQYVNIRDEYNVWFNNSTFATNADFKAYLAQQYANGTPVTVWYVLKDEQTGTVNEPLMKIGTYADTLSNATPIPTTSGLNTIDVNTTVKPSEMSLTYDGYKICKHKRKSANLFDTFISGIAINTDTGAEVPSSSGFTSDFIAVDDNSIYSYSGANNTISTCFFAYDSAKAYIGRSVNVAISATTIKTVTTVTSGYTVFANSLTGNTNPIAYIRVGHLSGTQAAVDSETIMLNSGSTALPYAPYWK